MFHSGRKVTINSRSDSIMGVSQMDLVGEKSVAKRKVSCCVAFGILAGIAAFVVGIVIGRYAMCNESNSQPAENKPYANLTKEADPEVSDLIMNAIDSQRIKEQLRFLSSTPHLAGGKRDRELASYIKAQFKEMGLDTVQSASYDVLLSFPDPQRHSSVQLTDTANDDVIYDTLPDVMNATDDEEVVPPYHAYSPSGFVEGDLIYVNYGRVEDFAHLKNKSIDVTGKIVIAKYGKIFRGSKVRLAQQHGVKAILIYSDPKDYTRPQEDPRVLPDTIWLPPSAVQRGNVFNRKGDPLTPGYPSTRSAFRFQDNDTESDLPNIPSYPLSYEAAIHFLRDLEGDEVPESWRGGLNITYRYGPLKTSRQVRMNITNFNDIRAQENVIGTIRGQVEPDRYVLFGNHRDAWIYGAVDPSSATAAMLEMARAMGQLVKQGRWRPRRSIMFCSWAAEEFGLVGSTEWVEHYVKSLKTRAVAYVNLDLAVAGNYSLFVQATPLMYQTVLEAAKRVPNPNPQEIAAGRKTVYDTWLRRLPWGNFGLPLIDVVGSGSDHTPMIQTAGITCVNFAYIYNLVKYDLGFYPMYHTRFETFQAYETLQDQNFTYTQALSRYGAEMVRSLADSLILPFNVSHYSWALELNRMQLHRTFGQQLENHMHNYSDLQMAVQSFADDVTSFQQVVSRIDKSDPMAVRMVNDQLLLLEKAFLDPNGLPGRPLKKHLLFAESSFNTYAGSSFPGLVDLLFGIEDLSSTSQHAQWQKVRHHFSVIVNVIQAAGFTLRDVTNFVQERY